MDFKRFCQGTFDSFLLDWTNSRTGHLNTQPSCNTQNTLHEAPSNWNTNNKLKKKIQQFYYLKKKHSQRAYTNYITAFSFILKAICFLVCEGKILIYTHVGNTVPCEDCVQFLFQKETESQSEDDIKFPTMHFLLVK